MKDSKRFNALLASLREGKEFAAAFSNVYGGSPPQIADRWAAGASRRRRR